MRLSLSLFLLLSSTAALADPDAAPEIIVTGQRYDDAVATTGSKTGTALRDIPAAVSVVSGQLLADQDVRSLDVALTNASSVAPIYGGGYGIADNYVIRGLPMRFLRDGLPDGNSFNGYRRTLADVASIEVLKGPGSALYGRAEAGGSVNVTTLAPEADLALRALGSYGRFDTITAQGDVTGGLAEGATARLIGAYERSDGYRGLRRRLVDILPTVAVELGQHRLTFDYDHREQRFTPDNYGQPFTVSGNLAATPDARFYSPFNRSDQTIDRFTIVNSLSARDDLTLRAALVYDRRSIALIRNAGGNPINAAGVMTGRNGRTQRDEAEYWTGQAEAVWSPTTGSVQHTLLVGSEYSSISIATVRRNYNLPNLAIVNGVAINTDSASALNTTTLAFDRRIASDTLSVYGQEQVAIGSWLKLRAGGRYDSDKLDDQGLFGAVRARIAGTSGLFSWQAGAVVQPSSALSLYGGYAQGKFLNISTEAANLSSNFARLAPPAPESSRQIEFGIKAEPIAGKLHVNAAIFQTHRDNYFVTLVAGGDPVQVGKQRSRGVEFDLVATPLPGLNITANAAYVDAINLSSALVTVAGIAINQSSFGNRLAATPRYSGSLWTNYEVQSGGLAGLSLGVGAVHKSSAYADALELLRVPGYTVFRAALGYRTGPFEAQLTVANFTDRTYYTVPTFIGALPGEPRSLQFSLRTRF